MFEQDYVMRLIKEMVRAILKLLFNIDTESPTVELLENKEEQETLENLLDMVDAGEINEAENRLYDLTSNTDVNSLEIALLFYSYLNDKTDDFLEANDFSRDEIKLGLENVVEGQLIKAKLDMVLGNDITSPVAINEFEKAGFTSVFDTEKIDYWQERMVYTLTEKDLTYRYSEAYDGYFVSLDAETKKLFDSMPTTKLLLDFDFTSLWCENKGYNVIGFDYNAFSGFYIDTLTVKSAPTTLYVKDSAFDDATVKTLKHSAGISWDGLTDIGWEVVVL